MILKKFKAFTWYEEVHNQLLMSFTFENEDVLENALETLLVSTKSEMNSMFKKSDLERAEILLQVVKHCIIYLHIQKLLLKEGFQGCKYLYSKIISCFIDLCIFLSQGLPTSSYLDYACQELFLCSGDDVTNMWDSLLHCCLLKKVNAIVCCPVLRRALSVPVDRDLEPKQYMKFLLLCRLWKVFTPDASEKTHIKSLVAKVKVPHDFMEFLSLFPIAQISSVPGQVKKEKVAMHFLCKKFQKNILMEMKQVLCDETCRSVSQVTVPSPPVLSIDNSTEESLFFIDRGKDSEEEVVSPDCLSAHKLENENYDIEKDNFPDLTEIISSASKQAQLSLLQENMSIVPDKIRSILDENKVAYACGKVVKGRTVTDHTDSKPDDNLRAVKRRRKQFDEVDVYEHDLGSDVSSKSSKIETLSSYKNQKLYHGTADEKAIAEPYLETVKQQSAVSHSACDNLPDVDDNVKRRKCEGVDYVPCSVSESETECESSKLCSEELKNLIEEELSTEVTDGSFKLRTESGTDNDEKHSVDAEKEMHQEPIALEAVSPCDREKSSSCSESGKLGDPGVEDEIYRGEYHGKNEVKNVNNSGVDNTKPSTDVDENISPKKLSVEAATRCETWFKECEAVNDAKESNVAVSELLESALSKNDNFHDIEKESEIIVVPSLMPVETVEKCIPVAIKPSIICRSKVLTKENITTSCTESSSTSMLKDNNFACGGLTEASTGLSPKSARQLEMNEGTEVGITQTDVGLTSTLSSPRSTMPAILNSSPSHSLDLDDCVKLEKSPKSVPSRNRCSDISLDEPNSAELGEQVDQCRYVKCLFRGQDLPSKKNFVEKTSPRRSSPCNRSCSSKFSPSNSVQIALVTPLPSANVTELTKSGFSKEIIEFEHTVGCSEIYDLEKSISKHMKNIAEVLSSDRQLRSRSKTEIPTDSDKSLKSPVKQSQTLCNNSIAIDVNPCSSTETSEKLDKDLVSSGSDVGSPAPQDPARKLDNNLVSNMTEGEVKICGKTVAKICNNSISDTDNIASVSPLKPVRHSLRIPGNKRTGEDCMTEIESPRKCFRRSERLKLIQTQDSQSDSGLHTSGTSDDEASKVDSHLQQLGHMETSKIERSRGSQKRLVVDLSKYNVLSKVDPSSSSNNKLTRIDEKAEVSEAAAESLMQRKPRRPEDTAGSCNSHSDVRPKRIKASEKSVGSPKKSPLKKATGASPYKSSQEASTITSPTKKSPRKYNLRRRMKTSQKAS